MSKNLKPNEMFALFLLIGIIGLISQAFTIIETAVTGNSSGGFWINIGFISFGLLGIIGYKIYEAGKKSGRSSR